MVTLILMLAVALVVQWRHTQHGCWESSISAYYYTPARGVVVAALIAIGGCMIAIKGSTEVEDILLNLAGMLAAVVAFVPSHPAGLCRPVRVDTAQTSAQIVNNMTAVFAAGFVALMFVSVMALRAFGRADLAAAQGLGLAISWATLLAGLGWFLGDRAGFESAAHYTAAALLFVSIIAVVVSNAIQYDAYHPTRDRRPVPVNRYSAVALAMLVGPAAMAAYRLLVPWRHAAFAIEGTLIVLFAVFWLLQTQELWVHGLRNRLVEPAAASLRLPYGGTVDDVDDA